MTLRLTVHTLAREEPVESSDDTIGLELVRVTLSALQRGGAPPSAVVLRGPRLEIIPIPQLLQQHVHVDRFIAGLSRSNTPAGSADQIDAVGVIGVLQHRIPMQPEPRPVLAVMLEWADCRWWNWRAQLEGTPLRRVDGTDTFASALEGDTKPQGLGGWWSLGRRDRLQLNLDPIVH